MQRKCNCKSGGYGEHRFDEIEFNLQPPNNPAIELQDEMEPEAAVEDNPAPMDTEEKPESAKECEGSEERNVLAREEPSGSQGALAKYKPDTEGRGRPRGEERWRMRVKLKNPSSRSSSESPARLKASRELNEARAKERNSSLANRRGTGAFLGEMTAEGETRETGGEGKAEEAEEQP